jgi:acetyltransferase-like isoleucine patch superfamily enzyme
MIINSGFVVGKNPTIRDGTALYPNVIIGDDFQSGHWVLIREHTTIGNSCSIGTRTEIGPHCIIGNNVRIHSNCFVPEYTEIFDNVWIGPCVCITNTKHPLCENAKNCLKRTRVVIQEGAIIGAGCIIMPEVIIGKHSIVGAGSLVAKNVDPNSVVFGNPAEKYKYKGNITCKFDSSFKPYIEKMSIPPKCEETVSQYCRRTHVQKCFECEDLSCCDNTNEELMEKK